MQTPEPKFRLQRSLGKLIVMQFVEFWYYYLGAIICLFALHHIQSELPFMAKKLAEPGVDVSVWMFGVFALAIILFRTGSRLLFFYPARVLQKELRVELLRRLESVSPSRYGDTNAGQLFQVIGNDMEQMRALIGFALLQVGNIVIACIVLIPKLTEFHSSLLLPMLPMLVAFVLFSVFVSSNIKLYKKNQDMQGEVQNLIIETYAGKKTIKNFQAEGSFLKWFADLSQTELTYFYRAGLRIAFSIPLVPLGIGLSFVWGAHTIFENDLGASTLILFFGFIYLFQEPLTFVSWIGVVFTRSFGSWQRVKELVKKLETKSAQEQRLIDGNYYFKMDAPIKLEFWGKDFEFDFIPGQKSVLVGKTGVGKTHLLIQMADLLTQMGKPIAYVAQDPYLYDDSVEGNLFLGLEPTDQDRKRARELLELFSLELYEPHSTEDVLQMSVGENGKRLSGGQVKRLALIRSLLSGAPILIWDDPFSSVDVIQERVIFEKLELQGYFVSKTILMTSHRLTTVKFSDLLFYLDKEKGIVASGGALELLEDNQVVKEYFKEQMDREHHLP